MSTNLGFSIISNGLPLQATFYNNWKMRIEIEVSESDQELIEKALEASGQNRDTFLANALRYYAKLVTSSQRESRHTEQMQSIYDSLINQGYAHSEITANMIRYRMKPKTGIPTVAKFLLRKSLTLRDSSR